MREGADLPAAVTSSGGVLGAVGRVLGGVGDLLRGVADSLDRCGDVVSTSCTASRTRSLLRESPPVIRPPAVTLLPAVRLVVLPAFTVSAAADELVSEVPSPCTAVLYSASNTFLTRTTCENRFGGQS